MCKGTLGGRPKNVPSVTFLERSYLVKMKTPMNVLLERAMNVLFGPHMNVGESDGSLRNVIGTSLEHSNDS